MGKTKSIKLSELGLLMLIFISFTDLADFLFGTYYILSWVARFVLLLAVFPVIKFDKVIYRYIWLLFFITVTFISAMHRNYGYPILIMTFLCVAVLVFFNLTFLRNAVSFIFGLCLIHLGGIFLQYISPNIYEYIYLENLSLELQNRIDNLQSFTYLCGFTIQPAIIGTILAIGFGVCIIKAYFNRNIPLYILSVLFLLGLILTAKRAHLLFAVLAVLFCYTAITINKNNYLKYIRVFLIFICLVGVLYLCYLQFDMFTSLSRFFDVKNFVYVSVDDFSSGRISLIRSALEYFRQSPFLGIGFNIYQTKNQSGLAVHNVYIQYLCEGGIFVALLFVIAIVTTLYYSIQLARKVVSSNQSKENKVLVVVALHIQSFFYMYFMTGNSMFDYAHIYMLATALAIIGSIDRKVRKDEFI